MHNSRKIFIWDIHGCFDELQLLIKKIEVNTEDKIYFTWDLINKWPKSYKVIKLLYKNRHQYKVVLWNHDLEFLKYLEGKELNINFKSYNKKFEKLLKKLKKHPPILEYFKNIPLYIEEDDFLLIHWWLIPWKPVNEHSPEEICYIRTYKWKPWYEYYSWDKKVIYWHWAIAGLNIKEKTIWIDTWCCYWKYLTAYILETWEIITQQSLKQYVDPFKNKSIINEIINYLKRIYENFKDKK